MRTIILFDDPVVRVDLMPFTYTRPIATIRCGILTLVEKWRYCLKGSYSFFTETYLQKKFPITPSDDNLYINGSTLPTPSLVARIQRLALNEALYTSDNTLLALRSENIGIPYLLARSLTHHVFTDEVRSISKKWHITQLNGSEISADLALLTANQQKFVPLSDPFTRVYCPEQVFIEEGAILRDAVLNATEGPIYIGKNALVQEGSMIQGPFAMGEGAVLAQGAKMRPNTTIGPYCKAGGEINNSVLFAYSNKGHEGYLGNSVLGEWCNLGADTNNSNLKNDYTTVKLFSYATGELEDTGRVNCGLFMGDYSKSGINTMFNTGTVVGVHVNVFGGGFQDKFIPSFTWGGKADGYTTYRLEKALSVAQATAKSKNKTLSAEEARILEEVFTQSAPYRAATADAP